jgi:hypothetical protein
MLRAFGAHCQVRTIAGDFIDKANTRTGPAIG